MANIAEWLRELDLAQYAQVFAQNEIDFSVLQELDDGDLRELGLPMGPRKKILRALSQFSGKIGDSTAAPAAAPADAERRHLTVMFCDLVGSTALSTELDPEDYREAMRAYQDACAGVITRFDGYVARFMGDGVLAYFGWPRAHEDDAARAINAGLGVVAAVGALAPANGASQPLAVRIGIATGPVVIGDIVGEATAQEAAVVGETPNLAARLEQIAAPDSVVISESTRALAGGLFDYETLGPQSLKGFDGAQELWRVVGERQVESRFAAAQGPKLTPLIGRDEELELLQRRWRRAVDGEGQVVLLVGEPGIGKSRLTRALQDTLNDEPHVRILLQCSPHHTSSALYPVIGQLELAAGFAAGDSAEVRLAKLETLLSGTDDVADQPPGDAISLVAALLSLPADARYPLPKLTPQQQKDRTLAVLDDHLAGLTRQQPVLFILEDAHWIDPTTQELIELAVERLRNLPILLVITYRPEFAAPWVGDDHVSLLALSRLTRKDRSRMARALLGDTLSEDVLTQIAERSDGIPLFVEELTRAAREVGAGSDIPATLQDALEARFDRSPAVREVAQVGAAIGRQFDYGLLAEVASLPAAELETALEDLLDSGLIFVRGTPPDASYTFKHALIQDTAYGAMVRTTRQATHRRIAEALVDLRPGIAETAPQTLAHHYTEANLLEAAVDWWTKAGQAASARSANPEAVTLLERGLSLIPQLPEGEPRDRRELAIQTASIGPLISVKGQYSTELETAYSRTLDLCERVDAPQEMFRALFAQSLAHGMRGGQLQCKNVAETLVERARDLGDEGATMIGHRMVALGKFLTGDITGAKQHTDIVLSKFDRVAHGHVMTTFGQDPAAIATGYDAVFKWVLGWPDRGRRSSDKAVSLALELNHVGTLGPVLSWGAQIFYWLVRDIDGLRLTCKHFQHLVTQHNMPIWEMMDRVGDALLECNTSPSRKAAGDLNQALEEFRSLTPNAMIFPAYWGSLLAQSYASSGDFDQALIASEAGFEFSRASHECWSDAELCRVRGEIIALRDGVNGNDEAESWLRRAIEDARSRQAKSFELRAAISLARLYCGQGRHAEARETLAPVYGWFTEGFDTPDLIDAKALLDELG